jgi:hypothetical protein
VSVVGLEATPADYATQRCCPYHGGWIRLADCPIVATNEVMLAPEQRGMSTAEALGGAAAPPDIEIDLGGSAATDGRFTPGKRLKSRVDGRERLIVAAPPSPPATGKSRRFGRDEPQMLESPAQLAASFGGQRVRPVRACPDPACAHPLPANIDIRDPISVAIVGNSQASKTTTMAVLMQELGQYGPAALGVESFAPTERTSGMLRKAVRQLRAGDKVDETPVEEFQEPLEFSTELRGSVPVTMLVHDVSGENLMDRDKRMKFAAHVLWADVVLFIYNPEESPTLGMLESDADQSAVLTGVYDDLEYGPPTNLDGSARWPKLVVAVSKADLLRPPPDLSGGPAPEEDVIQALYDLQEGNLVYAAKRWGDDVRWRFIAPQPSGGRPYGVADLFKQVIELAVP